MVKYAIARLIHRMGYTVIPNWQLSTFPIVADLRRRLAFFDIDLVVDVGANAGQYRDLLRNQVGYAGRIVSFEPTPFLARELAIRASKDPLWTVVNQALGASVGSAEFNIMADTQFSSFFAPRHDDVALFTALNRVAETVAVEVSTLDLVLPPLLQQHAPRGVFLKLDTQGYDLEVLRGATSVLSRVAALQTEAAVRRIYDAAPGYQETLRFLEDRGFVLSGILPNNEGHFPLLVEFDCHLIRADLIKQAVPQTA